MDGLGRTEAEEAAAVFSTCPSATRHKGTAILVTRGVGVRVARVLIASDGEIDGCPSIFSSHPNKHGISFGEKKNAVQIRLKRYGSVDNIKQARPG